MKIRTVGAAFDLESVIDIQDFMKILENVAAEKRDFDNYDRYLYYDETKEAVLGLFLTIKDHKSVHEKKLKTDGKVFLKKHEFDNEIATFNYFVLHKPSQKILYQHYYHSAAVSTFMRFLKVLHDMERDRRLDEELDKAQTKAQIRAIKKDHRGTLKWSHLIRQEDLPEILKEFERITRFQYEQSIESIEGNEREYSPVDGSDVRTIRRTYTYGKQGIFSKISRSITSFVRSREPGELYGGAITGLYANGDVGHVDIFQNRSIFKDYEFDDVVGDIDPDNISDSMFVKDMLGLIQDNKELFPSRQKQ